jgi:hypothetical protein
MHPAQPDYTVEFLIVLPFVAAFFYVYFRINYPWLFWRAARRQGPLAPEKRRRPGWLARLRAKTGIHQRRNRWSIGYSNPILPVSVKLDDLRHHTLLCGATGSGKTSALQLLIDAFAGKLPIIVVDCKASTGLHDRVVATPDHDIWTIGGSLRWDPLRGDPTSVANRLIQGEWYARDADIYRAAAERYLLWLLQAIDLAGLPRTPERVLELLEPNKLLTVLRELHTPEAARLTSHVHGLGQFEREGVAGFRARFGLVVEGITGQNLGPGLTIDDAIQAGRTVLFSLDAASYPALATKIGAWILLDLVRVAAQRVGPCLVIVDEFSALGREGRHVVPLLARTREAGMMCVLATQGLADLARVDASLPQQITQNTAVRLALRQGSAEDQEGWSALLGGAPVPFTHSRFVDRNRARAVSPDDLATLRTGEAFLHIMPAARDGVRKRLWIARPRKVGARSTPLLTPETELTTRTPDPWLWPTHTEWRDGDAHTTESASSSEVADNGTRPGDRGRGVTLAATHDASDRALVFQQSAHGEQPDHGSGAVGLPEDDRHPVACVCACHGDGEGSPSASGPPPAAARQRAGSTAARPDRSGDSGMADGPGSASRLDHGAGAAAGRAERGTRPGRPSATGSGPPTRRRARPSQPSAGGGGSRADPEARPD